MLLFSNRQRTPNPLCLKCGLYKGCKSPFMGVTGEGRLKALIIAEAPGADEDAQGVQLVGDAGQFLRGELARWGLDLDRDFWKINSVNCRPPKNRDPKAFERDCCWEVMVKPTLERLKPAAVILLGSHAVASWVAGRSRELREDTSIGRWRGRMIPDQKHKCWVFPLYHPSAILRSGKDELVYSVFERDLRRVALKLRKGLSNFPIYSPDEELRVLTDFSEVREYLTWLLNSKPKEIVFDYETTGLRPWGSEFHKVLCVGVYVEEDGGVVFPVDHGASGWSASMVEEVRRLWSQILSCKGIGKVAHNIKFEAIWSRGYFGVDPTPWLGDTMVTAHILDCRTKTKSLKFLAYDCYGIEGWGDNLDGYMRGRGLYSKNRLESAPFPVLLRYCGWDAVLEGWLRRDQRHQIETKHPASVLWRGEGFAGAERFFLEGTVTLDEVERGGIRLDVDFLRTKQQELVEEQQQIIERILNSPEAEEFQRITKRPLREASLNSNKDLPILLFKVLGFRPLKTTASGAHSVDDEVLQELSGHWIVDGIRRLRRLNKLIGTYLVGLEKVSFEGRIYPSFNLHIPRTYRSSSSDPNFQNIPIRDSEASGVVRSAIIPDPGFGILEADYGAIEVRIIACLSKDERLVRYLNSNQDLHREAAALLFKMDEDEVLKPLRQEAKSDFVFPEFYGSWWKSCARNIWEKVIEMDLNGVSGRDFMAEKGFLSLTRFEKHVQSVEEEFWRRFQGVKRWQAEVKQEYLLTGGVSMPFGFRRREVLNYNKIINTPVQGTAFHCLLWSLIQIHRRLKDSGFRSRILGQIHDSIVVMYHEDELVEVVKLMNQVMTVDLVNTFDWIIVPMVAEFDVAPVGGSWNEKREVDLDQLLEGSL